MDENLTAIMSLQERQFLGGTDHKMVGSENFFRDEEVFKIMLSGILQNTHLKRKIYFVSPLTTVNGEVCSTFI